LDQSDDLNRLVAMVRKRIRVLWVVAAVVMAEAVLITLQLTPRYTANATVMIDTRKHSVTNIEEVLSGLPDESTAVDTEVEVLKSRSLAERVVTAMNLDKDPEFNPALGHSNPIASALAAPLDAIKSVFGGGARPASAAEAQLAQQMQHEAVVDAVLANLNVKRATVTYVINVNFDSTDPVKAEQIANAFADKYLSEQLEAKFEATQQATQWLTSRLAELEPQVQAAETAVQQYKAAHGLLASVNSSLTQEEISGINTQLAQAKADEAEKDARVRTAQQQATAGASGEDLSGPLNSATMMQLRSQQAEASSKVADLETKYGPRHPEVQRAQRQLADIDAQITQEVGRQVSNLKAEDDIARQRVASLQGSLAGAKGTLVGNNAASVELDNLQRKADAVSSLYASYLNRAKQTSTSTGDESTDARVVSHAKVPVSPSFPNRKLSLALGLVLALSAGVAAVFIAEALDDGIGTSEDIEHFLRLPSLGSVPLLESTAAGAKPGSPAEYPIDKPLSAFAEAFRNLRASLMFSRVDGPVKVVVVTSSLPGEGKTTTALCLARTMALSGAKTVLVDCDLRRRNVNRQIGIEPEAGLVELLLGKAKLEDVLISDERTGASILPLAKSAFSPKDLLGSAAMDHLLAQLRARYDFVVLDTAPVIPVSDTRVVSPKADVVLFLVQWRRTSRKAVAAALGMLTSVGAEVAGVAMTLVDMKEQAKYGYGDAGYYYRSYRKYYAQ